MADRKGKYKEYRSKRLRQIEEKLQGKSIDYNDLRSAGHGLAGNRILQVTGTSEVPVTLRRRR